MYAEPPAGARAREDKARAESVAEAYLMYAEHPNQAQRSHRVPSRSPTPTQKGRRRFRAAGLSSVPRGE